MIFKILSLNLWATPAPVGVFEQAVEFIKSTQADVMLIQEVNDAKDKSLSAKFNNIEALKKIFPNFYFAYEPAICDVRDREGKVDNGQLVISRYPITTSKMVFIDEIGYGEYDHDSTNDFSQYPAGFQMTDIMIDGKKVRLLNVHGPVWLDGEADTPRRQKMAQAVLDYINIQEYVVVAGDFNARPSNPSIQLIESKLHNIFKDELHTTFNIKRKDLEKFPGYVDSVVDMMLISKNLEVVTHECPQVDISDHLPLVAEIKI